MNQYFRKTNVHFTSSIRDVKLKSKSLSALSFAYHITNKKFKVNSRLTIITSDSAFQNLIHL